jgi:hypothetical protein
MGRTCSGKGYTDKGSQESLSRVGYRKAHEDQKWRVCNLRYKKWSLTILNLAFVFFKDRCPQCSPGDPKHLDASVQNKEEKT